MKNKCPKISVIVPVYNVESYLEKCLNSLVNQSYPNLEIILVDDSSTDSSGEICKKYSKQENIKYIKNDKNRGLSYTRNHGMQEATGEYIGFIDSDDYVDENYYESLFNSIKDADICVCDITLDFKDSKIRKVCGNKKESKEDFINCGLAASSCNKLFKKEIWKDIQFEVGKINEDVSVIIPLLVKHSVTYDENVTYYYVQRDNSIQNFKLTEKRLDIIHAIDITLQKIKDYPNYDKYKDAIIYNQIICFLMYVPEKENNSRRRLHFLKKFRKSCTYTLSNNINFLEELENYGIVSRLYLKLLMKTFDMKLILLTNMLISLKKIRNKNRKKIIPDELSLELLIEKAKKINKHSSNPKVSVIIPNYNYSKFLYQRVYSILNQTYHPDEIIILDDCSKDDSRKVIDEMVKCLSPWINIKKNYNDVNSGKAFIQWEKGFQLAKNDYVWIAEADDFADKRFLKTVMNNMKENVIISYVDTSFIDEEGKVILKSVKEQIDLRKTGHWDHSYINNGEKEFSDYTFLNCTIANVSGAVIRKGDYHKAFKEAKKYSQAGDWVFYSNLMHLGNIAYSNKTYNYYRVHGNNVSTITKKTDHFKEIKTIHDYYDKTYKLNSFQKQEIDKRYKFLTKVWKLGENNEKTDN